MIAYKSILLRKVIGKYLLKLFLKLKKIHFVYMDDDYIWHTYDVWSSENFLLAPLAITDFKFSNQYINNLNGVFPGARVSPVCTLSQNQYYLKM